VRGAIRLCLPGSPVTYRRYTRRHEGLVGGFSQRSLFSSWPPDTGLANLWLVGDSVFPGQSTAGVTAGGLRTARQVARYLDGRVQSSRFKVQSGPTLNFEPGTLNSPIVAE